MYGSPKDIFMPDSHEHPLNQLVSLISNANMYPFSNAMLVYWFTFQFCV